MTETRTATPLLTERFQRALALAGEVHGTQVRKGTQIPYVAHLLSVAALVLENGGSEDAAIAGLLHDAVEDAADGAATEVRIRHEFGNGVAETVMGCSDAVGLPGGGKPPWRDRKEAYLRHLRADANPDVWLVSACDKLHNARSIVADLHSEGSTVWERFSAGVDDQLWYYEALAATYGEQVPAGLREELRRVVGEMRSLAFPGGG